MHFGQGSIEVIGMYQQVAEVHDAETPGYVRQNHLLKLNQCVAEPEQHNVQLTEPLSNGDGGLRSCQGPALPVSRCRAG